MENNSTSSTATQPEENKPVEIEVKKDNSVKEGISNKNIKLNFIHLCDYVSTSDGKLNMLGIFESVFSKAAPFKYPQIYIVTNVSINQSGTFKQIIKAIKDKEKIEIIKPVELNISIPEVLPGGEAKVGFIGQINNIEFNEFGVYTVEVFINEQKIGETKINAIQKN